MANTEKIFVDLNEDIVFILEQIRESSAPKVILVVPKSANVTSSLISLKILAKQLLKTNKLITIVTEDSLGLRLGDKAGLMTKENIGEIDPETWEHAKKLKEEKMQEYELLKRELLGKRQEKPVDDYRIVDESPETTEEDKEIEDTPVDEDELPPMVEKKRIPPKVVTLNGIKFFSAGDIIDDPELLEELSPRPELQNYDNEDNNLSDVPGVEQENTKSESKDKKEKTEVIPSVVEDDDEYVVEDDEIQEGEEQTRYKRRRPLTGTNWANATASAKPSRVIGSGMNTPSMTMPPFLKQILSGGKKKYYIYGVIGLIIFFFVYSYLFTASVSVRVNLKKDTVDIDETITADPTVDSIDTDSFIIPGETLSAEDDASENALATGAGTGGEKAAGQVDIYNKTTESISLPAGTVITIEGSGLKYVLNASVSIDASDGTVPEIAEDINMIAADPGEQYNSPEGKNFTVESYTTSEVVAKNFRPIVGGTTEDTKVVSQEDMDTVKDILQRRVESTATTKLESLAGSDEIMIPDTITVEVIEETSTNKVGEEAERFDVTIKAKVSALFIKKSDLEEVVTAMVQSRQAIEGDSEVNISEFPDIGDVVFEDGIAKFKVSSKASARATLTTETIAENIAGKSLSAADEYLDDQPDIESYKLTYSPSYIPSFLKKVPSGDKLEVRIGK